nr:MAG TPA: hypothetical protein [Caudoviricetes sp.]
MKTNRKTLFPSIPGAPSCTGRRGRILHESSARLS